MISPKVFERHGCDAAALRKIFEKTQGYEYSPKIVALLGTIRSRMQQGRLQNLKDYRYFAAMDYAYDAPYYQTTPTLVQYQFTSGMLNNAKRFAYRYGYMEARVKMPKGFSMWPALWLRDWQPWSYEIDAMEGFDATAHTFRSTYWWGSGSHWSMENDANGDVGILNTGGICHAYVPLKATTTKAGECSVANSVDLSAGYHRIGLNWTPTAYEIGRAHV